MLPILFAALGCAFFVTGLWPVALAAFVAAAVMRKADEYANEAVAAARAVGADSPAANAAFGCADLMVSALLIVAILVALGVLG